MKKVKTLENQIALVKQELLELGSMRPGSLTKQKRKWGGEYLQLSYSHKGKGCTTYIKEEDKDVVVAEIANFKRFRELSKEWVDLAVQVAQVKAEESKKKRG